MEPESAASSCCDGASMHICFREQSFGQRIRLIKIAAVALDMVVSSKRYWYVHIITLVY